MTEVEFIEPILHEASALVKDYYGSRDSIKVSSKSSINDLLTEADLAVQELIVARIKEAYPGDTIVAEEAGLNTIPKNPAGRAWVIDPIDGTQNFMRGLFPLFGVSIAFAEDGIAKAGGVILPMQDDIFLAEAGNGAYRNGKRMAVSTIDSLSAARVEIDFSTEDDRVETIDRFSPVIVNSGQIRSLCTAVVSLCSLAAGELDVYLHVTLKPWDYAAAQLLVEEAGGVTSRLAGEPLRIFDGGQGAAASNGILHDELLSMLADQAALLEK
jgi:myo-inositol-1(or 4)-monophosphatase